MVDRSQASADEKAAVRVGVWERKGVGEDAAVVKTEDCTAARDVDESYVAFVVNDIAGRGHKILKEAWLLGFGACEINSAEPPV